MDHWVEGGRDRFRNRSEPKAQGDLGLNPIPQLLGVFSPIIRVI